MADISITPLGRTPDGRSVERYALCNAHGITAELMTYGATLMALRTPDCAGQLENVALSFETLGPYLVGTPYFGATVGRYANRIAGGRFELDGREYKLSANDGRNSIHGGALGFDTAVWNARPLTEARSAGVVFNLVSVDGDQGYPGELAVEVTYRLSDEDCLRIDYWATTSKPTPINLTHHSYFNLSGDALREITDHDLVVDADRYLPVNAGLIPTGQLRDVSSTAFDFRTPHRIGRRIDADDEQLRLGGGYDHTFVLNKATTGAFARAALVSDPINGRTLDLWTTEPGLQVYTGNSLDGSLRGAPGRFRRRTGLCLEPQHFPNSPNEPSFPSTILRPGEEYRSRTEFRFGVAL